MSKEAEFLSNFIHNMSLLMCENSENYKKYQKVRKLHQEICNSMSAYITKYESSPDDLLEHAKTEVEFSLDLRNKQDAYLYTDMIIYPYLHEVKSLTEIYLETGRFRKQEKIEMLEAMKDSRLGVYEFVSRDPENAISIVRNVITREEIPLTDSSLGEVKQVIENYNFVLRVIHYQDIYFQTGMIKMFKRNNTTRSWYKSQRKNISHDEQLEFLMNLIDFHQRFGLKERVLIR